jgi:hypothetical protein
MVGLNCNAASHMQTAILSSELSFQIGQTILVGLKFCSPRCIVDVDVMQGNASPGRYRASRRQGVMVGLKVEGETAHDRLFLGCSLIVMQDRASVMKESPVTSIAKDDI